MIKGGSGIIDLALINTRQMGVCLFGYSDLLSLR